MKFNLDALKSRHDLRTIVESDLGKSKRINARYGMWRCPFHGDRNPSLQVWADGFKCYGCGATGDTITWIMRRHYSALPDSLAFRQAIIHLGGDLTSDAQPRPRQRADRPVDIGAPPSVEWQAMAWTVVTKAHDLLWHDPRGERALDYLRRVRGLADEMIEIARLGYIPAARDDDRQYGIVWDSRWRKDADGHPVRVSPGILIPHIVDGQLWAIRTRRAPGLDPKYLGVAGSRRALYGASWARRASPIIITEGEFDALIINQCADDLVSAVALASASNAEIDPRWYPLLMAAPTIFARMDEDSAGARALEKLAALAPVRPVSVPTGKDVNDFYLEAGGESAIRAWIQEMIS